MYDLLIQHGRIITGAGNPWFQGDIGVKGGKIVAIGQLSGQGAGQVINVQDNVVCPGFIDGHSHSDLFILSQPQAEQKLRQGVTTENLGLDGMSVAPIDDRNIAAWRKHLSGLNGDPEVAWSWRSFGGYLDAVQAARPALNITAYVGLGTIRLKVMGMVDRPAEPAEIEAMKQLAGQAMEEGARGISAGLIYAPGQYQSMTEVVEIAKVVRQYDGIYDIHLRSESHNLLASMQEAIEIGRRSGIPVLITHFKVMGRDNWGLSEQSLRVVDEARDEGIEVSVAQYPYLAGSTTLLAVVPPWFHAKGPDNLLRLLRDDKETIKKDIAERSDWENFPASLGWQNIVVSSVESKANLGLVGKSLVEIAEMRGLSDPADAALDLLAEEELAVGMILHFGDEKDLVRIMRHPSMSVITDGLLGGRPHPRVYGTFPRILGRYVREQGILTLEEAVRKMTSSSAQKLRLKFKGLIAENFDADITIFDPERIIDNATYEDPRQFPTGIEWVIVNGQVVIKGGEHTGARPGKVIRTR